MGKFHDFVAAVAVLLFVLCVVFGPIVALRVRCVGKIRDFVAAVAGLWLWLWLWITLALCGKIPRFRCGGCRCMCSVRSELLRDVGKFYDFVAAVAVVCGLCRVWADCERLACAMSASP